MMEDRGRDGYRGDLNRRCVTHRRGAAARGLWDIRRRQMARDAKAAGREGEKTIGRCSAGSIAFTARFTGAGNFYDPGTLMRDNTMISPFQRSEYKPRDRLLLHRRDQRSCGALHRRASAAQSPDKPLFLYVAYTAAHWPMHALGADIAKYKGKYDGGYAADSRGAV